MFLFNASTISRKKAIAYYRHSAEDKQENSVEIQKEQTEKFAQKYDIEIIHYEKDEGKSGLLGPEGRPGFKRLFEEWIENKTAMHFDFIFVYDVSRWGRFQDPDQAGYYERICRMNGKKVVYISRGFVSDEYKEMSDIQTIFERKMASQYSKQLSVKVKLGCIKVSEQGYSAGGTACYGMVRWLLDVEKKPVQILKHKEHKAISNARVTFGPANDETTQVVKDIFLQFTQGKSIEQIAEHLNERKIPSAKGGKWNREKIKHILTNETYTGTRIYNKTSNQLKQGHINNPKTEWVIVPHAFPGIIDIKIFRQAQEIISQLKLTKQSSNTDTVKRVHRFVRNELRKLFLNKHINEDDLFITLKQFPVIYSIPSNLPSKQHLWCFVAPHEMRRYKAVLGISIKVESLNPIDKIFVIPTNEFGLGDFSIFSEQDEEYIKYYLEENKIEEKVSTILQELNSF